MSLVSVTSSHGAEPTESVGGRHWGPVELEEADGREVEGTCRLMGESVPHGPGHRCVLCYPTVHSRRCSVELGSNELPHSPGLNGSEGGYTPAASR